MEETMISVQNFRKAYKGFQAVAGISFDVRRGEIFGLLGPNGAGKTTTLECLEGLRKPDEGVLRILDVDPAREPKKLRNLIGVQLQTSGLPGNMTVTEAMRFFCSYHGVSPRIDLIDRLDLKEKRNTQYSQLSTGQQRRLALALAMAHKPPVLFLDEPTAGLDVGSRTELHEIMKELQEQGATIILATHDMAEAEKMADRVAILLKGKVVTIGTPLEITATGSGFTKISVNTEQSTLSKNGTVFPAVRQHFRREEYDIYYSTDPAETLVALINCITERGDKLVDLRVERPTLEERFLEITSDGGKS